MGATVSRGLYMPLPQLLETVYSKSSSAAYTGWHGVGMSMAAKAVAEAAKESNLFDVVVLVTAGEKCTPRKLQRRIAEKLEIRTKNDDDGEENEKGGGEDIDGEVAKMIYKSLSGRNFMLIVDKLLKAQGMGLGAMGVPTPQQWSSSKVFITSPYEEVIFQMNIDSTFYTSVRGEEISVTGEKDSWLCYELSNADLLGAFLHDAAGDVANSLGISDLVEVVFSCCIYLCLFQSHHQGISSSTSAVDAKELLKYYVGEGFITLLDGKGNDHGLEGAFRDAEALLAQLIGSYMAERSPSGQISVNSHLWEIQQWRGYLKEKLHVQLEGNALEENARWISLAQNQIRTLQQPTKTPPPSRTYAQLSTLLLNDNPELKEIPDTFFNQTPNLKVLDLSRTSISSLTPSLSSLVHLRFLKLQLCPSLHSLPPSLKHLKKLILLDCRGTTLSHIPSEAFDQQRSNLRFIDLSYTNIIHSLPPSLYSLCNLEQLFLTGCGSVISSSNSEVEGGFKRLQILDLSHSPQLKFLPTSLFKNLTNLRKLLLAECDALEGGPRLIPCQLRLLPALEEVDISGCGALKDVEDVSLEDMPKLRALNLSDTRIARLSLTRCPSLEIVHLQGLANLKSLHLSGINIKEFPHEISELTRLEQLHLSDVKHLKRVNWEKLKWLPEKLEWDECGCRSRSRSELLQEKLAGNRGEGPVIAVSSADIFKGISLSSPLWEQRFSNFHFYLSPCLRQYEKREKKTRRVVIMEEEERRRKPLVYAGIYHSQISHGRRRDFSRHLEMEGVDCLTTGGDGSGVIRGIQTVVKRAEVLSLRENGFLKSLCDLRVEEKEGLEECWVEKCHNIVTLFSFFEFNTHIRGPYNRLWLSDLRSLRSVYDGSNDFLSLRHLHIEYCPKLECLFLNDSRLTQLETLHIRFCTRLECVFKSRHDGALVFPKLQALLLWQLPKLHRICGWTLPSLQHLRVRACPRLQQLPRFDNYEIKIEGESDWWDKVTWVNDQTGSKEAINFQSKGGPDSAIYRIEGRISYS